MIRENKKLCRQCGRKKLKKFFSSRILKSGNISWMSPCRKCVKRNQKQAYIKNSTGRKIIMKKYFLKKKYSITLKVFEDLLLKQNKKCAICGLLMRRICVDHCHKTKKVRELLCNKCNSGIGQFNDDLDLLDKARAYIIKHKNNT